MTQVVARQRRHRAGVGRRHALRRGNMGARQFGERDRAAAHGAGQARLAGGVGAAAPAQALGADHEQHEQHTAEQDEIAGARLRDLGILHSLPVEGTQLCVLHRGFEH